MELVFSYETRPQKGINGIYITPRNFNVRRVEMEFELRFLVPDIYSESQNIIKKMAKTTGIRHC